MKRTILGFVALMAALASSAAAQAGSIGVNFTSDRGLFDTGPNPIAAGDLAGLVPQTNWNNTDPIVNGTTVNIVGGGIIRDNIGAATATTITWGAIDGQEVTLSGVPNNADSKLYKDYLENDGSTANPITVTIGNIAYVNYDVIVYVGDFSAAVSSISKSVLNGTTTFFYEEGESLPFGGYVQAVGVSEATANVANYVRFDDVTGAMFSLDLFKVAANRSTIAAIQVVEIFEQVPEPGTLAIFGLGLAGLGFTRRRKAS